MLHKVAGAGAVILLGSGFFAFAVPAVAQGEWSAYWEWALACLLFGLGSVALFLMTSDREAAATGQSNSGNHLLHSVLAQFRGVTVHGDMFVGRGPSEPSVERPQPEPPQRAVPNDLDETLGGVRFVRHGRSSPVAEPEWDRIVWVCPEHHDVIFTHRSATSGRLHAIPDPHANYVFGPASILVLHCAGVGDAEPHEVFWDHPAGDFWELFTDAEARLLAKRHQARRAAGGEATSAVPRD